MKIEDKCVNYLRINSVNMVTRASSGHPGVCLGAAPIVYAMYKQSNVYLKKPNFFNRDRIVFSAGHASALIYSALNLFGANLSMAELKNFRKLNSKTPGHPEYGLTDGVDVSTGPLGQGVANAVGFALAERRLAAIYNKPKFDIVNHYTYCFTGDGCLMEGVSLEAISLAGHLKLNKLILLYDYNNITIEGKLNNANSEDTALKFRACNWNVIEVENGNDVKAIESAIKQAKKSTQPTLIMVKTKIGYGSEVEDNEKSHGSPLTQNQVDLLKTKLDYKEKDFVVPADVKNFVGALLKDKENYYKDCSRLLNTYKNMYKCEYKAFIDALENKNINISEYLMQFANEYTTPQSTRDISGKILNIIDEKIIGLFGGTADLAPSTKTFIKNGGYIQAGNFKGKNIHFGIREHAMAAVCNGLALHGGLKPYCSTFFTFANYMTPAMRMSAIMHAPVLYILSHDSIAVGEDGATHQPIEQIATLRAMPNMNVFRPCNFTEMVYAFDYALNNKMPTTILTSRQNLKPVSCDINDCKNGAYIISEIKNPVATLIATGSEVGLALDVQQSLKKQNIYINVVSMPCCELFDKMPSEYKNQILKGEIFTLEASSDNIWYKYATSANNVIKLDSFGKSGNAQDVFDSFGFNVLSVSQKLLEKLK